MTLDKIIIDDSPLTLGEIELIQFSWSQVEGSIEMAIDFYNKLFYLYPALRPLFREDIRTQARKFTAHLTYLVRNARDWNSLKKDVTELGKRHLGYEVKNHHYEQVREALFFALKTHLKNKWDQDIEMAWSKFYRLIADKMKDAHH